MGKTLKNIAVLLGLSALSCVLTGCSIMGGKDEKKPGDDGKKKQAGEGGKPAETETFLETDREYVHRNGHHLQKVKKVERGHASMLETHEPHHAAHHAHEGRAAHHPPGHVTEHKFASGAHVTDHAEEPARKTMRSENHP